MEQEEFNIWIKVSFQVLQEYIVVIDVGIVTDAFCSVEIVDGNEYVSGYFD